jgi:hypothetical protein
VKIPKPIIRAIAVLLIVFHGAIWKIASYIESRCLNGFSRLNKVGTDCPKTRTEIPPNAKNISTIEIINTTSVAITVNLDYWMTGNPLLRSSGHPIKP